MRGEQLLRGYSLYPPAIKEPPDAVKPSGNEYRSTDQEGPYLTYSHSRKTSHDCGADEEGRKCSNNEPSYGPARVNPEDKWFHEDTIFRSI